MNLSRSVANLKPWSIRLESGKVTFPQRGASAVPTVPAKNCCFTRCSVYLKALLRPPVDEASEKHLCLLTVTKSGSLSGTQE